MELEYLKRIQTLTTIVETQVRLIFETYIMFCYNPIELCNTCLDWPKITLVLNNYFGKL